VRISITSKNLIKKNEFCNTENYSCLNFLNFVKFDFKKKNFVRSNAEHCNNKIMDNQHKLSTINAIFWQSTQIIDNKYKSLTNRYKSTKNAHCTEMQALQRNICEHRLIHVNIIYIASYVHNLYPVFNLWNILILLAINYNLSSLY